VTVMNTEIRYVAILDTETTSLEPPPAGRTIEVAVMLYDIKLAQPVASYASLICNDGNEEYGMPANPAEAINGIPGSMLADAPDADVVWRCMRWLISLAEVIIAHNAAFDRQFCPDLGRPWLCSENDIQWPGRTRGGSLVQLALSMGLGVASAHRAMSDVDTLARIFTRSAEKGCDLEAMIRHGMRPKKLFYAQVPYEKRQLAKDAGFRWDEAKHGKNWYREMAVEDTKGLPFPVKEKP